MADRLRFRILQTIGLLSAVWLLSAVGQCAQQKIEQKPGQKTGEKKSQESGKRWITFYPIDVDSVLSRRITVKFENLPVDKALHTIFTQPQMARSRIKYDMRYVVGKNVSLDVKDLTVATALAAVAEQSGVNLYRSGDKLIFSPAHAITGAEIKAQPFAILWSPNLREPLWRREADAFAIAAHRIGTQREQTMAGGLIGYLDYGEWRDNNYFLPSRQAIISLGRLGDQRVAGPLTNLAKQPPACPPQLAAYYRVALARIKAETGLSSSASGDVLSGRLEAFLASLGLTPREVEERLRGWAPTAAPGEDRQVPVQVLAMREMADMLASARKSGEDTSAAEKVIDLASDPASYQKVQLAGLAPHERISRLLERLSQARALDDYTRCTIQALGDEGAAAAEETARKLRELLAQRGREAGESKPIEALLMVLSYAGGPGDAPVAEAFMHDQNKEVAEAARRAAWALRTGTKQVYAPEY